MKRSVFVVLAIVLIAAGIFIIMYVFNSLKPVEKGALQITSNLKATVTLNGSAEGKTPVCLCPQNNSTIQSGQYEIKITPDDKSFLPYAAKVNVEPGVLTVVDRTFLPGSLASSSIITLVRTSSKQAQLSISTLPQGAMVLIDSNPVGITPYLTTDITASEHEIQIQRKGFAKKTLRIKTVPNYKLVINALLGTATDDTTSDLPTTTPTPSVSLTPTVIDQKVVILNTPTGFLRVRSQPSLSGTEVGRVTPGDTFSLISQQPGWFEITLANGSTGWISSDYAKITGQ